MEEWRHFHSAMLHFFQFFTQQTKDFHLSWKLISYIPFDDTSCCKVSPLYVAISQVAELTVRLQNLCALYGLKHQHLARWMGVDIVQGVTGEGEEGGAGSMATGREDESIVTTRHNRTQGKAWRFPSY